MLQNYLLTTLRNLRKHFTYSAINIIGLALGLATYLLLVTWIRHELSFDRFHSNADRIYRVSLEYSFGGQTNKTSVSPTALLPALQKNFPEVENGVRVYNPSSYSPFLLRKDEKLFQESYFYFADSTFFDVFSFRLLEGNANHALVEPRSVVITHSMAKKYFGELDPMGHVLQVNNRDEYTVTGVMEDVPANSLLQFDFIASFSSLSAAHEQIWWSANYQTFALLTPDAEVRELEKKTAELVQRELKSELTNPNDYVRYNFMRLTDIYLKSDMNESEIVSSINYVYGFGAIAVLILLIATINYVNLATARAADRAREVSIRKVVGAVRKQLFTQFLGESLIITFVAFLVAYAIALISLPLFNSLTGKNFSAAMFVSPAFLFYAVVTLLFIALIAGVYPAFAMTSFKPVAVLKGNFKSSGRGIWLRKSLVVFQFCVSIILIVGTIVVLKQLNYLQSTRLGYEKENVLVLPLDRKSNELYSQLRAEILKTGNVARIGRGQESPTKIRGGYSVSIPGKSGERGMLVTAMTADSSFLPALGMQLTAGRNFTASDLLNYRADTITSFILNESALNELMIDADNAVGTVINMNGRHGPIVGVVKDFHFASLHTSIGPLILFNQEEELNFMFIKLKAGDMSQSIQSIKAISNALLPHRPFEYEFLDLKYAALYSSEQKVGVIGSAFATLAIVIACLGLFGLVAFAAAQKTKEIGIRKVLGATIPSIVVLITRDYARLVVISIVMGLPVAWWIVENLFLNSFAYHVSVGIWPFVIAGVSCLCISFTTASFQAIKAAVVNPIDTLRNE